MKRALILVLLGALGMSAPAKATATYGRVVEQWWIEGMSDLIVRAARGEDLSKAPRFADQIDPAVAPVLRNVGHRACV